MVVPLFYTGPHALYIYASNYYKSVYSGAIFTAKKYCYFIASQLSLWLQIPIYSAIPIFNNGVRWNRYSKCWHD